MVAQDEARRMWSRHDASITSKDGRKRKLAVKECYQVIMEAGDSINDVVQAANLPEIGEYYKDASTSYPHIRCTSKEPTQVSPIFWQVQVTYEGELGVTEGGGDSNNPLDDPPEISWGKSESDEPIDEDWDGKAIVTPNGEPVEGVTMKLNDLVLNVKRNFATINLPGTYQYLHSVNSDEFLGFPAGTAKITQYSANQVYAVNDGGYWEVSAAIQFRYPYNTTPEKAWYARVRNEGYYVRRASDNEIIRAFDPGNKEPTTRPVLLNADGTQLTLPEPPTAPVANWLEFKRYQPLPYSTLGLV